MINKITSFFSSKAKKGNLQQHHAIRVQCRLTVRFIIDFTHETKLTRAKHIIKNHLTSENLGKVTQYRPNPNFNVDTSYGIEHCLRGAQFYVFTETPEQTIADLIYLLQSQPEIVGTFSIHVSGTNALILAPSKHPCQQALYNKVDQPMLKHGSSRMAPYTPIPISDSLLS